MSSRPFVSIILCVRNGMPYLQDAVQSILALDYSNYEVVVQDGASTDGSLEYLRQFEHRAGWSIVSRPDSGIGQGFNWAVQRCRGEVVGSVDADNRLRPDALKLAAQAFFDAPESAAVYGNCGVIDAAGEYVQEWVPPHFDLLDLMDGTVVPPFASSFFSRRVCADDLRFDETMSIVPDFDLWLRLSSRPIVKMAPPEPIVDVRVGKMSSSWTKETYDLQCSLKSDALKRFLDGPSGRFVLERLFDRSRGGLYLWGVDSMGVIGAGDAYVDRYFDAALAADIKTDRFRDVVTRTKPRLRQAHAAMIPRIFDEGLARLRRLKFEDALVYLELLQRSGTGPPGLEQLIDRTRSQTAQAEITLRDRLMAEKAGALQEEVDRRDRLMVEKAGALQGEVDRRDAMLAQLESHMLGEVSRRDQMLNDFSNMLNDFSNRVAWLESLRGAFESLKRAAWNKVASMWGAH